MSKFLAYNIDLNDAQKQKIFDYVLDSTCDHVTIPLDHSQLNKGKPMLLGQRNFTKLHNHFAKGSNVVLKLTKAEARHIRKLNKIVSGKGVAQIRGSGIEDFFSSIYEGAKKVGSWLYEKLQDPEVQKLLITSATKLIESAGIKKQHGKAIYTSSEANIQQQGKAIYNTSEANIQRMGGKTSSEIKFKSAVVNDMATGRGVLKPTPGKKTKNPVTSSQMIF